MGNPLAIDGSFGFTKREAQMYKSRSLKSKFNLKEVVWEWCKAIIWGALFSLALLGWILFSTVYQQPSCSAWHEVKGVGMCLTQ